jgi:putative NADPH-quinone reductase
MRVLLIYAHPLSDSYAATLRDTVMAALRAGSHTVDLCDLYQEGFDPVVSAQERRDYKNTSENTRAVSRHVDRLRQAEGVILVFPSWWYGMPAILKGYFDRVWVPGVALQVWAPGNSTVAQEHPDVRRRHHHGRSNVVHAHLHGESISKGLDAWIGEAARRATGRAILAHAFMEWKIRRLRSGQHLSSGSESASRAFKREPPKPDHASRDPLRRGRSRRLSPAA